LTSGIYFYRLLTGSFVETKKMVIVNEKPSLFRISDYLMEPNMKFLVLLIIFYCVQLFSQTTTMWSRTFGGWDAEYYSVVEETSDNGYIVAGYTYSFGFPELAWFIKLDANGDSTWDKLYGPAATSSYSIQQTLDGGYITTGDAWNDSTGSVDVWLMKTDEIGNSLWTKKIGGNTYYDGGFDVRQTMDSGYIIIGDTYSFGAGERDILLVRTDSLGNSAWMKTFGGSNDDFGNSVQQTNDGGYILIGATNSFGNGNVDLWLIKTNSKGDSIWSKTFGGVLLDAGATVLQTSDLGFILTGWTKSFGSGEADIWLIKTDSNGDSIWSKTYGGMLDDYGNALDETSDGGFIIVGSTESFGFGKTDVYLMRVDSHGDTLWTKTYGGELDEGGYSVRQTFDGGYIIAGSTESFGAGNYDFWIIKTDSLGNTTYPTKVDDDFKPVSDIQLSQNYPNPFNPSTSIQYAVRNRQFVNLKVYDVLGKEVATLVNEEKPAGEYNVEFRIDNFELSSGIYFYQLRVYPAGGGAGNYVETKKMILMK